MSKKKDHKPEELSAAEALGKRVDSIMDPNLPDDPQPTDVFKDAPTDKAKATKTAPEVSGQLLKKVDSEAASERSWPTRPSARPTAQPAPLPEKLPQNQPKATAKSTKLKTTDLDDWATGQAVDDIAAKEANTMLALQDAIGRKASRLAGDLAEQDRRRKNHRQMWFLLVLIILIALFLFAVPYTRYTCSWPVGIRLRLTTDILPSVCK